MEERERHRIALQAELDGAKAQRERNRLGQFATPPQLARAMLRRAAELLEGSFLARGAPSRSPAEGSAPVRFLDPAIGTGAFYSALLEVFGEDRVQAAVGYEVDPHYGLPATELWAGTGIDLRLEDFTRASPPPTAGRFDLLICNPPYVRHHHLAADEKQRLKARARRASEIELGGLAGLYCYFMGLAHEWLADGGLAGWLIPSEFMDVVYGGPVKRYLLEKTTLLYIHRFDHEEAQFPDALVSSAVVWYRKQPSAASHRVAFSYGGTLAQPAANRSVRALALRGTKKWTQYPKRAEPGVVTDRPRLSAFFGIRRGQVTGDNGFFILTAAEAAQRGLPTSFLRPLLPSLRHLATDEVETDQHGYPVLDRRLFLLDCRLPEDVVRERHPALWRYLQEGRASGVAERYLCRNRNPWYVQERRPPALFACTYIGRRNGKAGGPFRFILNHSQATAANVYLLMYPHPAAASALRDEPALAQQVWQALRNIPSDDLLAEGRMYGGGLHKIEPRELGNVPAPELAKLLPPDPVGNSHALGVPATAQPDMFG